VDEVARTIAGLEERQRRRQAGQMGILANALANPAPQGNQQLAQAASMEASTRHELFPSEDAYFKENPDVTGMVSGDDMIVLNPYSALSPKEKSAVQVNEYARLVMKQRDFRPGFDITPGQSSMLDATTYKGAPQQARRETIAARLASGDPSGGTPTGDQLSFVRGLREWMR
tara:strand:- start:130 stop:645 length:516 start_codon:yes stop_codon:yes gene_type:complete